MNRPGSASSAASSPLQDWAAPPLGGESYSRDLSRRRTEARRPLASEALKYLGSGVSPKRSPPLMGFSSLVADLVTVTPPQFLAYTREGFTEPSDARLRSPSSSSDWINASRRVTSPSCWLPHGTVPRLTPGTASRRSSRRSSWFSLAADRAPSPPRDRPLPGFRPRECCLRLGSALLDLRRVLRLLTLAEAFPYRRSPSSCNEGSSSHEPGPS
jgi:hypothetical protein